MGYADKPWLAHYPPHVPPRLEYPDITMGQLLERTARQKPDGIAVRLGSFQMTYRELYGAATYFAAGLQRLGVRKGDRVALMLPNLPQYVIAYYGTMIAGGIVAQVNPLYVERELEHLLNDSGAEVIVALDALVPRVEAVRGRTRLRHVVVVRTPGAAGAGAGAQATGGAASAASGAAGPAIPFEDLTAPASPEPVAINPKEDVAVLQYTGGTTGTSKGAMLTHFNLVANAVQTATWVSNMLSEDNVVLSALPLFHSYGMTACMNYAVHTGATMLLVPRFDPQAVLELIRTCRPTSFPGVPTMYVAINSLPGVTPEDLSSLRVCNSGGAAMPVEVMREFERRTGATVVEGYGLSEASPVTHTNPTTGLRKPGSIGLPLPDTECRIVDVETGERDVPVGEVGELCIRGPQVMKGYWNRPEETAETLRDGWLHTGDIARMDEDGYFYITDRKKEMIIAGGYNVYPREVEEVLYAHPGVKEAAVVGVPDPYRGETIKAFVVTKPGVVLAAGELDAHCRAHLAPYKVPREYEFRDDLPKSMVGKVLRRVLREEELARRREGQAGA
ncbi:MAG: long-chain fatty acid--CoA ligase [Clostridia bacterium]|nr:long-chain fatty acid--CoA ligase [Clostridia bacterium]